FSDALLPQMAADKRRPERRRFSRQGVPRVIAVVELPITTALGLACFMIGSADRRVGDGVAEHGTLSAPAASDTMHPSQDAGAPGGRGDLLIGRKASKGAPECTPVNRRPELAPLRH